MVRGRVSSCSGLSVRVTASCSSICITTRFAADCQAWFYLAAVQTCTAVGDQRKHKLKEPQHSITEDEPAGQGKLRAEQIKQRTVQNQRGRAWQGQARPTRPPNRPAHARTPPPTPSAPCRASLRRAGKASSRAKQRRVALARATVAGSRGIGRGVPEDSFAPTRPPSPPPVRCE